MTAKTKSLISKCTTLGLAAIAFVGVFAATSFAAGTAEPSGGTLTDFLDPFVQAFRDGHYLYAGSLALAASVAIVRRYGGDRVPWFHTRQGSMTLVLAGAFFATLAARLAGGVELTRAIAWDATCVAVGAAGGYAAVAALVIDPIVRPLVEKSKYAAPLKALLYFFDVQAAAEPPADESADPDKPAGAPAPPAP